MGVRFRRQEQIGPYVVDFACLPKKLIVEADGFSHFVDGASEADAIRDRYLVDRGYCIVRFSSTAIAKHLDDVLNLIGEHLQTPSRGVHDYR